MDPAKLAHVLATELCSILSQMEHPDPAVPFSAYAFIDLGLTYDDEAGGYKADFSYGVRPDDLEEIIKEFAPDEEK